MAMASASGMGIPDHGDGYGIMMVFLSAVFG